MTNALKLLTRICNSPYGFVQMISENYSFRKSDFDQASRAVRCLLPGNSKLSDEEAIKYRTHNIQLHNNTIWFENSNSKDWYIEFASNEEAKRYWELNIKTPIITEIEASTRKFWEENMPSMLL